MTSTDGTSYDVVVVGGARRASPSATTCGNSAVRFLILEAGPDVGHVWSSRWDSLRLFTPSQYSGLPGMDFPADRDTYPSRDDVARYLKAYASRFELPVRPTPGSRRSARDDAGIR